MNFSNEGIRCACKKLDVLLYTWLKKKELGQCGKNTSFNYPLFIMGGEHIKIGNNVSLFRSIRIEAITCYGYDRYKPLIKIGNNVCINPYCHIGAIKHIHIGNNVLIGSGVLITDHSHGRSSEDELRKPPAMRKLYSKGRVIIKDNVWIGEHAAILAGVTVGENAIIGANAVVTKDVPSNAVVAGNPMRIIRQL